MLIDRAVSYLIVFVVATIPLVFGAVHPIVAGVYGFLMVVGCGGGLVLTLTGKELQLPTFWQGVPLVLLFYMFFQAVPLPGELVETLSPARGERMTMVGELAGAEVNWITISDNPAATLLRSFFLCGMLLFYHALTRILRRSFSLLPLLIYVMVGVGVFQAVYGLLQFVKPQLGILWLEIKVRAAYGTIIYKNQYASLLNMVWPLAIAVGVLLKKTDRRRRRRSESYGRGDINFTFLEQLRVGAPLLLYGGALIILAVVFTLSRGGMLTMVFIGLVMVTILPFQMRSKIRFVAIFSLVLMAYAAMLGPETVLKRFTTLGPSGASRLDIYLESLPMLVDNWLTGIGIGSYSLLSPVYLKNFPANVHFDRVHNEYLELVIELGIPGGILLLVWIFGGMGRMFVLLLRSLRYCNVNTKIAVISMASYSGLLGFLLHGFVDFGWRLPANIVYCTTLLAIVVTTLHNMAVSAGKSAGESQNLI